MSNGLILIVEDEEKIAAVHQDYLRQAGYHTHIINNGLLVDEYVKTQMPDLILLDVMLPGKDGVQICRELREYSDVPVIMVSARVEEIDRLLGLEIGADDYICKPFSPREVVARVKAILRRMEMDSNHTRPNPGFHLDRDTRKEFVSGNVLPLTKNEFDLLGILCEKPGRIYSRNQLLDLLYPDFREVGDRTIDSHIKNLRKKIGVFSGEKSYIHSVYGVGYKFEITDD
jgi:two-component system response regulator BaeR